MKYAATYRSWLLGLQVDDCTLGAWLRLNVYAAEIEAGCNVGSSTKWRRIGQAKLRGIKGWDDPQLLRTTGTDAQGLARVVGAGLARWRGTDLVLEGYDVYGQRRASEKLRRLQEGQAAHRAHIEPPLSEVAKEGRSSEVAHAPAPLPSPPLRGSRSGSASPLQTSIPSLRTNGRAGAGAPHGATSGAETGPEGFERWAARWPKWPADPQLRSSWRDRAIECWAADDLEGLGGDEVLRHTEHQLRTSAQWKQRGPEGEAHYYVPTPWNYLAKAPWRRRGPWTIDAAAPPAAQLERGGGPVPAGAIMATKEHAFLMQLINDVDATAEEKDQAKRRWIDQHPGQLPPWAAQAQQQQGRPS